MSILHEKIKSSKLISLFKSKKTDKETSQNPKFTQIPIFHNSKTSSIENNETREFGKRLFDKLTRHCIAYFLDVFNTLQDISDQSINYSYPEGIKLEFHKKFSIRTMDLPYVESNEFDHSQVELIRCYFDYLRESRNIVLITNLLELANASETFKMSIHGYFEELWGFRLTRIDDDFIRDIFSICLKIWELKIISQITPIK